MSSFKKLDIIQERRMVGVNDKILLDGKDISNYVRSWSVKSTVGDLRLVTLEIICDLNIETVEEDPDYNGPAACGVCDGSGVLPEKANNL